MATAPAPPAPAQPLDLERVVATYLRIREAKSELTKKYDAEVEALDKQMETLEGPLLKHLLDHGIQNVTTPAGTFYRQIDVKPNITDDQAFYDFIQKQGLAAEALQRRISVGFVKQYMETHENNLPPPGVTVHREHVVRVRRPS